MTGTSPDPPGRRLPVTSRLAGCLILLGLALPWSGCHNGERAVPAGSGNRGEEYLVATSAPVHFLVKQLVGDTVDVYLVAPEQPTGTWYPDDQAIDRLQNARLVISNGSGLEPWLKNVTLRSDRLLDSTAGLGDDLIPKDQSRVHRHGPQGEQSKREFLSGTWLEPRLAMAQARAIDQRLTNLWPERAAEFRKNRQQLDSRLAPLQQQIQDWKPDSQRNILDPDDRFAYLLRGAGLKATALPESGSSPLDVAGWTETEREILNNAIVLLPRTADPALAGTLGQFGADTVYLNRMLAADPDLDYLGETRDNLDRLNRACAESAVD